MAQSSAPSGLPAPAVPLPPDQRLKIETGVATKTRTGWLEVEVVKKDGTRLLLHSKKNGQGYVDTDDKVQAIEDAVKAVLLEVQPDIKAANQ
eukprot:jgi/Chlat1/6809/Chrsp51S06508